MDISSLVRPVLTCTLAAALLGGCSGGGYKGSSLAGGLTPDAKASSERRADVLYRHPPVVLPGSNARDERVGKSFVRDVKATMPLAYISDVYTISGAVYGFSLAGVLKIKITGLSEPQGLFVDKKENLWVANTAANNIEVFAKGSVRPIATYNDPNQAPVDVTMCPNGKIYVSNITTGTISVYSPGKPNPIGMLSDPNDSKTYFVTCDAAGNVFSTFLAISSDGAVDEYRKGAQSGLVTLPIPLEFPGAIKAYRAGNLLIDDQEARTITEYTEAGAPTGNAISFGSGDVADFGITRNDRTVGGADTPNLDGKSWFFPSGAPQQTYNAPFKDPIGFAYDPGPKGI